MDGLIVIGSLIGVLFARAYILDTITEYYEKKEKEAYRQHILNMKL